MQIQHGKCFKDLNQYLECKPDLIILMIGTNDALGSFDIDSGLRYKKNNNLPEVPSFEKYKEQLVELIDKIGLSSKVAIVYFTTYRRK